MIEKKDFVFDRTKCNILIVDDSKTINKLLTKEFNKKNYTTFSAFSLKETREIINKQNIDYLILDINKIINTSMITFAKIAPASGSMNLFISPSVNEAISVPHRFPTPPNTTTINESTI